MSIQTRLMYDDNSMYAPEYAPASATPLATYKELRMSAVSVVETAVASFYFAPDAPSTTIASAPPPSTDRASSTSPTPTSSPVASSPSIVSAPVQSSPQISAESARKIRRPNVASQVSGTITQVSPARVVVDGATVDSLAGVLNGATYALDDRVLVQIRNPQIPLLMGVLS